jgi:hypothetical protein
MGSRAGMSFVSHLIGEPIFLQLNHSLWQTAEETGTAKKVMNGRTAKAESKLMTITKSFLTIPAMPQTKALAPPTILQTENTRAQLNAMKISITMIHAVEGSAGGWLLVKGERWYLDSKGNK